MFIAELAQKKLSANVTITRTRKVSAFPSPTESFEEMKLDAGGKWMGLDGINWRSFQDGELYYVVSLRVYESIFNEAFPS